MLFAKRLSFLVRSNVPILEGLHIIREQTHERGAQKLVDGLLADVSNGRFLSEGMRRHKGSFSEFSLHVVKVGEMTGTLAKNLQYLSEELKKRYELKRKIIGALLYPLFITVATIGLTASLTVYIFPKIVPIFESLKVELPLSTRFLIALSDFVISYGVYTALALIALVVALAFAVRSVPNLRYAIHRGLVSLPLVGGMIRGYNVANFARTLSLLLKSGISVAEAIELTSNASQNLVYKNSLKEIAQAVRRGSAISTGLKTSRVLFPSIVSHMVEVGEKTGTLSDSLMYIAELYESEIDERIKGLSAVLEPAIMIVMGLLVGIVAVSVIAPIYEITQGLKR